MNEWTFKKEISVGDIIKSLVIAGSVFAWAVTVENRFVEQDGVNEKTAIEIEHMKEQTEFNRLSIEAIRREIRQGFDRLSDKLDKKADKE